MVTPQQLYQFVEFIRNRIAGAEVETEAIKFGFGIWQLSDSAEMIQIYHMQYNGMQQIKSDKLSVFECTALSISV